MPSDDADRVVVLLTHLADRERELDTRAAEYLDAIQQVDGMREALNRLVQEIAELRRQLADLRTTYPRTATEDRTTREEEP